MHNLTPLSRLSYNIHESWLTFLSNYLQCSLEGAAKLFGIFDRAFGINLESLGDLGKVNCRGLDSKPYRFVFHGTVAPDCQVLRMLFVIIVGTVIRHHDKEREL